MMKNDELNSKSLVFMFEQLSDNLKSRPKNPTNIKHSTTSLNHNHLSQKLAPTQRSGI